MSNPSKLRRLRSRHAIGNSASRAVARKLQGAGRRGADRHAPMPFFMVPIATAFMLEGAQLNLAATGHLTFGIPEVLPQTGRAIWMAQAQLVQE